MPLGLTAYRFGDLIIASEWPLADLPPATVGASHWVARAAAVSSARHLKPYHTWSDGTAPPYVRFTRDADRRIIEFDSSARFAIDCGRRVILCDPGRSAASGEIGQLLTSEVLPLVAGIDRLTLHASSVARDGRAIAFVGASGCGKSTVAVRLALRGWSLLTDDVAIIDGRDSVARVLPMEASVRLWRDSMEQLLVRSSGQGDPNPDRKHTLRLAENAIPHALAPAQLHALFLMGDEVDSDIRPIEPRSAVAAILSHAFVLATDDADQAARLFDQVSRLVRSASIYAMPAPDRFEHLDRMLDAALAVSAQG